MQWDRIQELHVAVSQEQERTDAMHQQVQVVNERLIRVLREIGDRTESILQEYGTLVGEVMDANLADVGHGNEVPRNETSTSSVGN